MPFAKRPVGVALLAWISDTLHVVLEVWVKLVPGNDDL